MSQSHRILVIGTGSIGERHARCFLATDAATVGICEPADAVRERVAGSYDLAGAYASLDEALAERWDSAVVATPANTHIPIATRLVGAGIAPLIEKPLAVEPEGVPELMAAIEQAGVRAGVAYVYRAHPALSAMRDAIHAGRFGKPLQVVVVAGQHFPTYRPAYREIYYTDHARGGGATQDALTHMLNAAEWLVGPVTRVTADAAHLSLPGVTVEDTVHAIARHGDVLASYCLNQHQAPNETSITVNCEAGTARCEFHRHAWRWMTQPDTPWEEQTVDFASRDGWFTRQARAWLNVLEGKAAPLCTVEEALHTLRVVRAILASAQEHGQIPAQESLA